MVIQSLFLPMDRLVVEKPTLWQESKISLVKKFFSLISLMVLYLGLSRIYGIFNII